jgi:hypothetical protein
MWHGLRWRGFDSWAQRASAADYCSLPGNDITDRSCGYYAESSHLAAIIPCLGASSLRVLVPVPLAEWWHGGAACTDDGKLASSGQQMAEILRVAHRYSTFGGLRAAPSAGSA